MAIKHSAVAVVIAAAALLGPGAGGRASSALAQEQPGAKYAWADSCKTCHAEIYEAWEKTKHARAISRLSAADQQKECLTCHVTAGPGKIEQDGKFVNANIQCEGCHGPGKAHAADPAVRTGLNRKPSQALCEACHNDKSPHFRGFFYAGMLGFSHPVKK